MLGILAIGAAYVPIAIKQPSARREKIIENVKPAFVLQDETFLEETPWSGCIENNPKDTAYIIYTSGSSGEPKGVEMSHAAATNTIEEILRIWNIGVEDSVLSISAFDFDLSVFDIFGLLAAGGTVILINEDDFRDPEVWEKLIKIYGITIWNSAPALLDMFLIMRKNNHFDKLRLALVSGDWVPLYLPEKWYKVTSINSQFVALGGATEGGIWSNYYCVSKIDKSWNSIPYGQALPKQKYRIMDENFVDCGVNIPGELQIGGGSLAKGYINDEELTMKKFITDVKGERWYRTGDRGMRWADGTIEFLGRMDTQVKIRGHRIELGEIESVLKSFLGIKEMEGLAYEYLFTDVSNFFLNNIRQQYPQVKTELLNLDDWDPSKFGEFHVIIAAGVLNNTKNILETVNKLKHMLRDEGILLVTEPLEEHIEITVSQAFMMPKHSDVRCMTGHCFLTEEEWIQSFDEVGLETVRIFPDEQNKYAQFKQKLFIVRKKQIVYREFLKSILPTVMIPTEFVNVDNIPLSLNGKVDRKALVRNFKRKLSSKDSIIIDQQNSKKQIYTEVEKKMIEIMRIVSGNSNISYEDNLLENGFDSLLLSQASGKIVNEIPEASGLRFDEILRVALVTPMIKMISEYIERKNSESKQKEKVESNDVPVPTSATHNVMYILGSDKGKWKEALEKTMLDSDILVKETEKEKLKTEVKSDATANKYLLICKDNISEILAEVSELLAQEIIIQKVFLLNPEDAKNNDLYLGDVIVINGAPSVIDSWKEAVLGDMKAYVGSFAETCNIIKKEIDDGK